MDYYKMRKFESFLERKASVNKIIFIDLAYAEKSRTNVDISLGIKEKTGGLIGTNWRTFQLDVEDDFSIQEFKNICEKFKVQCSVFSGDTETYILK